MKQFTETFVLEMFGPNNTIWHKPLDGVYRPAELLAYQGRITEAIDEAERIHLSNYGNMHGVSFRVVTKSRTVAVLAGSLDHLDRRIRHPMKEQEPASIHDLAMLVRRLCWQLNKHAPNNKTAAQAMEYLRRKGLQGSILRDEEPT